MNSHMGPMYIEIPYIAVIVYYFQIWNKKKEHNIIISRVMNSHMGPMYIEILLLL